MMLIRGVGLLFCHCSHAVMVFTSGTASAAETITYTYDSLGRLAATAKSGGARSGETTSTAYDPAGNRVGHAVNATAPTPSTGSSFTISGGTNVNEGNSVFLSVNRTGGISSSASVDYSTANGSAVASSDYGASSGTLTFAPFETAKLFFVSTVADTVEEPAENFTVVLSNPSSGSSIGTGSTTININASNGPPPPNNPPSAVLASVSVGVCLATTKMITASDPDGDYPITVVSGNGPGKFAEVSPGGGLELLISGFAVGSGPINYIIQDSRGAQATGTINVTVLSGSGCQRISGGN
jgi:Calx-beta domain